MTQVRQGSVVRVLGPVVGLVAVVALVLSGCGSTGVSGEGVVTSVSTPSTPVQLSPAQVAAIVQPRAAEFVKAARAFHKCDRKVSSDSYSASPCLKKVAAETAVVDDALADLKSVKVPSAYATTLTDLQRLSQAGADVASKCKKANDQKCDQALARFRADEQSLLWDLDLQL